MAVRELGVEKRLAMIQERLGIHNPILLFSQLPHDHHCRPRTTWCAPSKKFSLPTPAQEFRTESLHRNPPSSIPRVLCSCLQEAKIRLQQYAPPLSLPLSPCWLVRWFVGRSNYVVGSTSLNSIFHSCSQSHARTLASHIKEVDYRKS